MTNQPLLLQYDPVEVEQLAHAVITAKRTLDDDARRLAEVKADHKASSEEYRKMLNAWGRARWGDAWDDGPVPSLYFEQAAAADIEAALRRAEAENRDAAHADEEDGES